MEMKINKIQVAGVITKSNLPVCDYSVNPYVGCAHACKYCYASFMKRFTNHLEPWGDFVDVKEWPVIKNPQKYAGREMFIGSVTDAYQPLEAEYKRTRALLEQLQGCGVSISIATKSDLVLRDLDLIKTFPNARISFSINTLNENFRQDMDKAVSIERRLNAMKTCYEAGIQTTCFISPIFPGITDPKEIILATKDRCNLVWLENLNLRGEYKGVILNYIRRKYPQVNNLYQSIYNQNDRSYWHELDQEMKEFAARERCPYLRDDDTKRAPFGQPPIIVNYFFHEEVKKSAKK